MAMNCVRLCMCHAFLVFFCCTVAFRVANFVLLSRRKSNFYSMLFFQRANMLCWFAASPEWASSLRISCFQRLKCSPGSLACASSSSLAATTSAISHDDLRHSRPTRAARRSSVWFERHAPALVQPPVCEQGAVLGCCIVPVFCTCFMKSSRMAYVLPLSRHTS